MTADLSGALYDGGFVDEFDGLLLCVCIHADIVASRPVGLADSWKLFNLSTKAEKGLTYRK